MLLYRFDYDFRSKETDIKVFPRLMPEVIFILQNVSQLLTTYTC